MNLPRGMFGRVGLTIYVYHFIKKKPLKSELITKGEVTKNFKVADHDDVIAMSARQVSQTTPLSAFIREYRFWGGGGGHLST